MSIVWLLISTPWMSIVACVGVVLALLGVVFLRLPWGVVIAAFGVAVAVTCNTVIYDRGWRDAVKAGQVEGAAKDARINGEITAAGNDKLADITAKRVKDQERIDALQARLKAAADQCGLTDDDVRGLPVDRGARPDGQHR